MPRSAPAPVVPELEPLPLAEPQAALAALRAHPAFAALPEATVRALAEHAALARFAPGEALLRQGEASAAAFLLLSGEAEVVVEISYGAVHVARLAANSLIGEVGLFANLPRIATVKATTTVEALRLARDDLLRAGGTAPTLLLSVIRQLGAHLGTINQAIGFHTHAVAALERHDFDPKILDELLNPVPELIDFAHTFRRMAEQIARRRKEHDELASAATIQRAMLPERLPLMGEPARFDLHAEMQPAREVGGDFYDFFRIDEHRLGFAIGDACGKGIPAALFMAVTRTVLRLVAREQVDVASGIRRANGLLSADNASSMFATVFYGVLDLSSGEVVYCNCGHNPPILLRGDGARELLKRTGPPIAIAEDAPYTMRKVVLAPGEGLFLYTDGATEASAADGTEFGEERLMAALAAARLGSARERVRAIMAAVDAFAAGAPQFDDVTCLALTYSPRPAAPQ